MDTKNSGIRNGSISRNNGQSPSFVFPQAQHFVPKTKVQNYFDAKIPPVVTVLPGELIHLETNDCYHGKVVPPNESNNTNTNMDPIQVLSTLPRHERNPITGPVYIEGAMPGDILAVTVHDIRPQGIGVACCGPHSGQLCHWVQETSVRFFDLSQDGTLVTMRDVILNGQQQQRRNRMGPIAFPASPMLGVIGVAPAGDEPIVTMPAGKHGGNLDNNNNGIGSTIYIPVNHPGALLSMGDMHASQGDGEISGNGVEIGGHVLFQCQVLKQQDLYPDGDKKDNISLRMEYPVTETKTHFITHGVLEENIPATTTVACEEAAKLLIGQWGFTPEEAFIFLSVKGNLGLCQSCHPDTGTQIAKMTIPKLPVCPRPFRYLYDNKNNDDENKKDNN